MAQLTVDTGMLISFALAFFGGIGMVLLGYVINRLFAPPKFYPMKRERFECGNPPTKKGRGWFTMQYYAYLVVFLTVEPVFIYLFLLLMEAHTPLYASVVQYFGLIMLMLIPPIIFGLDAARKIDLWRMREKTQEY